MRSFDWFSKNKLLLLEILFFLIKIIIKYYDKVKRKHKKYLYICVTK